MICSAEKITLNFFQNEITNFDFGKVIGFAWRLLKIQYPRTTSSLARLTQANFC